MRYIFLILSMCSGGVCFAGSAGYFSEFRNAVRQVRRGSAEDFALGDKLMVRVRELARSRKRTLPYPLLVTESVIFRSARLWYTDKVWRDRQLFADRKFYDKSLFVPASLGRSFEIMKLSGMDGVNFFMGDVVRERPFDAVKLVDNRDFYIIPTLLPNVHLPGGDATKLRAKLPKKEYLQRAFSSPHTLRFNGKPLVLCYGADKRSPRDIAAFFQEVETAGKSRISYIADIDGNGAGLWPEIEFAHTGRIRATSVLKYFDHLCKHLETADGIEYAYYSGNQRRHLAYKYYDEILMPIFGAACAASGNGKKIFAWKVVQGYFNCNASQTLDSDGTKTLRGYLELCEKHKVDMLCTFEWDETNENTNIEPTVAKPMANARILKYWKDKVCNRKIVPFAGDDGSLPNLIVSANRQLSCGQEYELELLNVPDGAKEDYSLVAEILDQNGKVVFKSPELKFDSSVMRDHTLRFPTVSQGRTTALVPRLIINYKKHRKTVNGLPPTALRGTVSVDYSWFSTPLRNLLKAEKPQVQFSPAGVDARGNKLMNVSVDLKFSEPLNAVEIVQNSQDLFAFDSRNEFGQNTPGMSFFKLSFRMMNGILLHSYKLECPEAVFFEHSSYNKTARQIPRELKGRVREGRWCHDKLIRVPENKLDSAVLTVSGVRLSGKDKGRNYEWKIKLSEVAENQLFCKVFDDTLSLTIEHAPKVLLLPLALNRNSVRFLQTVRVTQPEAMLAVRCVSNSGKVWWSRPAASVIKGKFIPVTAYSDLKGVQRFSLPAERVAKIRYDLANLRSGTILSTSAGRDFYANAGGPLGTATGFEGGLSGQISPAVYSGAGIPPERKNVNGAGALLFDGKRTSGLFLPNTFLPPRNGFEITFEITPSDVRKNQILFEQIGAARYLNGFRLSIVKGFLELEYAGHTPDDLQSALSHRLKTRTKLALLANKRQKIVFACNGQTVKLQLDGQSEFIKIRGIPRWLTISAFGGRGEQKFAGILHHISSVHAPGF